LFGGVFDGERFLGRFPVPAGVALVVGFVNELRDLRGGPGVRTGPQFESCCDGFRLVLGFQAFVDLNGDLTEQP
jgi:hypothetical protein